MEAARELEAETPDVPTPPQQYAFILFARTVREVREAFQLPVRAPMSRETWPAWRKTA